MRAMAAPSRRAPRRLAPLAAALATTAALLSGTASGSVAFGDRDVRSPALAVSARGIAVVTYATQSGQVRHVLAWGAANAYPHQTAPPVAQTRFSLDYSGGWKSHGRATFWRTLHNVCKPYTGPALPFFVAGCDAPDGSYWSLQSWQRSLPVGGFAPWTAAQKAVELHLSHWSGPLPVLEIYRHWTYGGALQGFFGRMIYLGQPVYGSRTASAAVTTAGRGTSTSTSSTPISGRVGSTTPRSARTPEAARSASRSSPRLRRPATRARTRREPAWARAIASPQSGPG